MFLPPEVHPLKATNEKWVASSSAMALLKPRPKYRPHKFVLLEALSATGLRSIRYAKEIPLVRFVSEFCEQTYISSSSRFVIANDLSASATAAMKRNVELNSLGPSSVDLAESASFTSVVSEHQQIPDRGKVRINEGDAW